MVSRNVASRCYDEMEMRERLKLLATKLFPDPFAHLDLDKKQIIDFACQELGMRSFADLGAVWNVTLDARFTPWSGTIPVVV